MSDERDNVIHVRFSKDGQGKRAPAPEQPEPVAHKDRRRVRSERADPMADLYSRKEVAKLFGFTEGRLRHWDRSGFLSPSAKSGRRRYYTFSDLIGIRAAKSLLDEGVPPREVRRSVEALRAALPKVIRPLNELRVVADGQTVVVQGEGGSFEPATGQLVLDFRVETLRDDVVALFHERAVTPADRRTAYEHYLEGCRLDEDEATFDQAERAYERALSLDPTLGNALTNLGNVKYRRGDIEQAERLYAQALAVDARQPEAHYNLGFLAFEAGRCEEAIARFEAALAEDASFADAHFNLAMALEELGRFEAAVPHWKSYLALEPTGAWADIATRHLRRE